MTDARRRVLFALPDFAGGGAQRVMLTFARLLDRRRFEPHLAVIARGGELEGDVPDDVPVHDLDRIRYAPGRLVRLVRRLRADTVFSTLGPYNLAIIALQPLMRGVRIVVRETSIPSEKLCAGWKHPRLWRALYRGLYPRADVVVCQSDAMADDLAEHFGVPREKMRKVYNPVDVVRIERDSVGVSPLPDGVVHIVSAGRLSRVKGFDRLLEAFAEATGERLDVRLTILGEGPDRGTLEDNAVSLGIDGRVDLPGFQANPYVWFRNADVYAQASHYEGLPNALLEAAACGCRPVAIDVPGGTREAMECLGASERLVTPDGFGRALRTAIESLPVERGPISVPRDFQPDIAVARLEALL